MNIAILLTCYNRKNKTYVCLEQVFHQTNQLNDHFSVYLVDDGSTDGTSEFIKQNFPQVKIIAGNGNLYWNRGMLLAWQTALEDFKYDAVIWLNDDTILAANALENLISAQKRHNGSIIVGSTGYNKDKTVFSYGGYIEKNCILKPKDQEIKCKYFNGNIVMVPVSVSDKIGLLDPYFSHAKGDFEYGLRASKNNIEIYVLPIIGYCDRNSPYVKWMDEKYSMIERLKLLYSPLGNNPKEAYHLLKQESKFRALKTFFYLNLKACFPKLFPNRGHVK